MWHGLRGSTSRGVAEAVRVRERCGFRLFEWLPRVYRTAMSTPGTAGVAPKATLSAYAPEEITTIVARRCEELSAHLGWSIVPPAVRVLSPDVLDEIVRADVAARTRAIRGHDREEGLLQSLASWVLGLLGPSTLGYFGTTDETLYLNGDLVPAQGAYVLTHELVHAAQWQRHPALFAQIDQARVAAEDEANDGGSDDGPARDRYVSLVTLVEGHATHHGRKACEARLAREAGAEVPPEEVAAFVTQLMALDPDDENTALVYVRGERALAALDAEAVDALFRDPEGAVRMFARRVDLATPSSAS